MNIKYKFIVSRYLPLLGIVSIIVWFAYTRPLTNMSIHDQSILHRPYKGTVPLTVDEPFISRKDSDMKELTKTHDIAIPEPLPAWTKAAMEYLNTVPGQSVQAELLTAEAEIPNFRILTQQLRAFKSLYQYFDPIISERKIDVKNDPQYQDSWQLYERLENVIFPWIKPHWTHVFDINKRSKGRGIVICIADFHFKYAATTIRAIREVLNSSLPIEVFYIQSDLGKPRRDYLETEFSNLVTRRVVDAFDNYYTQFGGWSLKPYAMLASSFEEVILIDADAYFFKKPDVLFEDPGYKKTGSLFFYDRTLFPGWDKGRKWIASFLPTKSSFVEQSRWWRLTSAHEQESGVVVINKRQSLLGLLATCKMNDKRERDQVTYKNMHGDKETFWIGYEMMQSPYAFIKSYGAVIGGLGDAGDPERVCGNQLHLDMDGSPLWWNSGLLRDKYNMPDRYLTFTHYAEGEDWDFDTSCIKETDKIREFSPEEHALALTYVEMDKKRRKEEDLINDGKWKPHHARRAAVAHHVLH